MRQQDTGSAAATPITSTLYGKRKRDNLTPEQRLAEHIGSRPRRYDLGGLSVGGQLRGKLGLRAYGALLDDMARKTTRRGRRAA